MATGTWFPLRVMPEADYSEGMDAGMGNDLPEGWQQPACVNHPETRPQWKCRSCKSLLCAECVNERVLQNMKIAFCSLCRGECSKWPPRRKKKKAQASRKFGTQLAGAFAYPLRKNGWGMILLGSLFLSIIGFVQNLAVGFVANFALSILQILLVVFGLGYLFAYMFSIIQSSGTGEDELPNWPDFGDFWNDMAAPFLRMLGAFLFCLGPAILVQVLTEEGQSGWLYWAVVGLGLFYLPMALIAVAMFDSIAGVNPMLVLPAIFKTFGHYLVAFVVLVIAYILGAIGPAFLDNYIPFIGGFLSWAASLYFLFLQMRILGVLFYCNQQTLNWFPALNRRMGAGE